MATDDRTMNLPEPNPVFHWTAEPWGHALRAKPLSAIAQHAFTTRQLRLRLPPAGPDDTYAAAWTQAAASVGAGLEQVMRVKQVHGAGVRVLKKGQIGALDAAAKPEADAIVSDAPGLVLSVQVADCVPILLADSKTGVAAAVHAGWRGTCAGVARAAVETMVRDFGGSASDIVAALGPSIGACCYEVGEEVLDAFKRSAAPEDIARWFRTPPDGSRRLDLWTANRDQLIAAGLRDEQVHIAALCTQTHRDVFASYRVEREGAGRTAALIRVP